MDATKAETSIGDEIQRARIEGLETQAVRIENDTGDLLFDVIAVDKNRQPNRRGLVFDWDSPADVDLAAFKKNPVMLWAHDDWIMPIGRWESVTVTSRHVKLTGRIPNYANSDSPAEQQLEAGALGAARTLIRDGYVKAVSIGFYVTGHEEASVKVNGAEREVIKVKKFELVEVSPCPIGAHPTAIIQSAPGRETETLMRDYARAGRWDEQDLQGGRLVRLSLDAPRGAGAGSGGEGPAPEFINGFERPQGGAEAAGDWPATRRAMAKALGARGAEPSEAAYESLAEIYRERGAEPPPWRDNYTPGELNQLHADGYVLIPGRDAAEPEPAPSLIDDLKSLREEIAQMRADLARLTKTETETQTETHPAEGAEGAAEDEADTPSVSPKDLAAMRASLRRMIQQAVRQDPRLRARRKLAAAAEVLRIKESRRG